LEHIHTHPHLALTGTARIGEKFLDWTDTDPPIDTILEAITLYWVTETFPTSIYPYRQVRLFLKFSGHSF
jgi:hypothetical protein